VLRTEGFLPSFVADGERALAAFHEARPDIVLLDLHRAYGCGCAS
jgi:two-component system response regulator MtrA